MRSIHTAVLLLATLEPPVSACALADHTGSIYQRAPTNGLSIRGPTLVLVLEELERILEEELLTLEMIELEELVRGLEELSTIEEELERDELVRGLEELSTIEEELERDELVRLLVETGQLAPPPPTTPYGDGWVTQVDWVIQLLPFS